MDSRSTIVYGDCVEELGKIESCSVDSICTDPPYELGFMGKKWDASGIAYSLDLWREALRVLKPGGHLLAFGGTRTYHRMACAIEDAGFEVRDSLHWVYGSGFPKSLDVSKAIDKAAGAVREVVGRKTDPRYLSPATETSGAPMGNVDPRPNSVANYERAGFVTAPATDAARAWSGWGTALKPAHEPIVMARKPLAGTVAANVLAHGVGGINVDGCRVGTSKDVPSSAAKDRIGQVAKGDERGRTTDTDGFNPNVGRWPPNLLLGEGAAEEMDRQSGERPSGGGNKNTGNRDNGQTIGNGLGAGNGNGIGGDTGGASRFFPCFRYVAKPSRRERDLGLDELPARTAGEAADRDEDTAGLQSPRAGAGRTGGARNIHPTVKPVALMEWLVRLVTPPGGLVLDPFLGSGTTGMAAARQGFRFIGIEREPEYVEIARRRILAA